MPDLIVSASAPQAGIAIAAAITTDLVAEIRSRHDLSPLVTAAVGRLTTGAALLGIALKGSERITLQMSGDGPPARSPPTPGCSNPSCSARAATRPIRMPICRLTPRASSTWRA
jgi:hypothetical protein